MSAPTTLTSNAAVKWEGPLGRWSHGLFHRVYYQGIDHYIYELAYNDSDGWDSTPKKLVKAYPGTSIAAIAYYADILKVRLYYFNTDGKLAEYFNWFDMKTGKSNWHQGATLPSPGIFPGSKLSAFDFPIAGHPHSADRNIRIYYQTLDGHFAETVYTVDTKWKSGHQFA